MGDYGCEERLRRDTTVGIMDEGEKAGRSATRLTHSLVVEKREEGEELVKRCNRTQLVNVPC